MPVTIGTVVTASPEDTGQTITIPSVNCQGSERGLVVTVHFGDNVAQVASAVFNTSESLTFIRREQISGAGGMSNTVEVWALKNPSSVTADVVVTLNTADISRGAVAVPLFGVSQVSMTGGVNGSASVTSSPSVTVAAEKAGGVILAALSHGNDTVTFSPNSPAIELADFVAGSGGTSMTRCAVMYREYGAVGNYSISGTWTASGEQTIVGVEIISTDEQPSRIVRPNILRPAIFTPGVAR